MSVSTLKPPIQYKFIFVMALLESFTYLSMKGKRQSKGEKKLNLRTKKATHQWQKQKND